MKEKNHLFSATGIPSLFLIFGVLMLVILSLLGYVLPGRICAPAAFLWSRPQPIIMPAVRQLIFIQIWFRH